MSDPSIWFPCSVDWFRSEMFDDATDGHRLAWVLLIGYIKSTGRNGKAKVRAKRFALDHQLSVRSVEEMLKSALKHDAITIDDDIVTLVNWRLYNDRARRGKTAQCARSAERAEKTTPSPSPSPSPSEVKKEASASSAPTRNSSKHKPVQIKWSPDSGWVEITEQDKQCWTEAYPACDIDRQLLAMAEWLKANPTKAHKSLWRRFITNWLKSAQDRGGDATSNPRAGGNPTAEQVAKNIKRQQARTEPITP